MSGRSSDTRGNDMTDVLDPWPAKQIQLAGGIMQAVSFFFAKLGIESLLRPFGILVIIGVLCGLASWSMGPAEGMRRVAADGHLNPWWGRRSNWIRAGPCRAA
jgi:hypothetical protein